MTANGDPQQQVKQLFDAAKHAREKGQWNDAIGFYSEIIKIAPLFAPAYIERGLLVCELGRPMMAFVDFERAIEIDPSCGPAYYGRGWVYHSQGNFSAELQDAQKGLSLDPQNEGIYYRRIGAAYHGMKRHHEAIEAYNHAIRLNSDRDEGTIYNRGLCYADMYQDEKAIADFSRALELDPDWIWALSGRAKSYQKLRNYKAAASDYRKIIQYHPNHPLKSYVRRRMYWMEFRAFFKRFIG